MHWNFYFIGKPKLPFARDGIEDYFRRLQGFTKAELHYLKVRSAEEESVRLLEASAGQFRIVLDERGKLVTSIALAEKVKIWETTTRGTLAVLIGGADGHSPLLREKADWLWSLSPLTLQHEMAALLTLEQIYRAYSINRGLPYHRV
jgi:23S rRNA (pseudouridine1915-N3)-methyltransferase